MKMTISVGRCLKSKVVKGEHKQKLCNLQKSLQLARIIEQFQRITPKCKCWVLKVLCLEIQMVCSDWLKNDSLCLRLQLSSKCCVASRCNGLRLDIQKPDQINFVLPQLFPLKLICDHFHIAVIHKSIFLNSNITSSPYLEMHLISMIKLLFLFFVSDRNVHNPCNLWRL